MRNPGGHAERVKQAVLFDFFGTLVGYQPDRARLGYPETHRLLTSWGWSMAHDDFLAQWDEASRQLETESRRTLHEFSMTDAAAAFANLADVQLTKVQCSRLGAAFVGEWQRHVVPFEGAAAMVARLGTKWSVGVVSNTHDGDMVPTMLAAMGLPDLPVVLSVDHGRCKPHPSIYLEALSLLGVEPDGTVFVGDNHEADYVGPQALGIRSYLIDPDRRHDIVEDRRLRTVLDIESILLVNDGGR